MGEPTAAAPGLRTIDMHFHVGVRGDKYPHWGGISERMRAEWPKYDIFLLYAGLEKGDDTDEKLERRVLEVIDGATVDAVVCLALDHVYDAQGQPRLDRTDFWVHNDYLLNLREKRPEKVLFGASVHPFRHDFKERVTECVEQGAVFMKWLPSSQQFSLADPTVREALKFLATAKNGNPLPLLLHTGVEYAVPTTNERTRSYDYLSWGWWDRFWNFWRFGKRWYTPDIKGVRQTLDEALREGAVIIMAHCGLPYFVGRLLRWLEHDDFPVVREYLQRTAAGTFGNGKCYADVSACATPFRKDYYGEISKLPENLLLFGSDFPTPVFELSADPDEVWRDFKAILDGDLKRIVIPQDNPIDVNRRELNNFFPNHPMFTNFDRHFLV
jgi:predicted TIM-barrel fold metal-dependent hydrolase